VFRQKRLLAFLVVSSLVCRVSASPPGSFTSFPVGPISSLILDERIRAAVASCELALAHRSDVAYSLLVYGFHFFAENPEHKEKDIFVRSVLPICDRTTDEGKKKKARTPAQAASFYLGLLCCTQAGSGKGATGPLIAQLTKDLGLEKNNKRTENLWLPTYRFCDFASFSLFHYLKFLKKNFSNALHSEASALYNAITRNFSCPGVLMKFLKSYMRTKSWGEIICNYF
jgi:hypothetical protein